MLVYININVGPKHSVKLSIMARKALISIIWDPIKGIQEMIANSTFKNTQCLTIVNYGEITYSCICS